MMDFSAIVQSVAQKYNVDPALINAVISKESSGDATAWNKGGGGQGAAGAMQVRAPALADYNAANGTKYGMSDLLKPQVGIDVGSWYLGQQLDKFNDPAKALVAYNEGAGSPTVQKGTSPYAQQVLGKLNMPQKAQTLPGIPTVSVQSPQVQDAFGSLAVDGQQTASAQVPQASSDPFSSLPVASDSKAPSPKAAQPVASTPGGIESFAAGLGKGFGSTVLGAQQLLGKIFEGPSQSTARAIGLDSLGDLYQRAGGWLVNDANQGLQSLGAQSAPYQQAHPIATTGGDIGGAIGATLPLGLGAAAADTLLGAGLRGIATGAAGSAASPVDPNSQNFWGDKAQQVAIGGGLGGLLGAGSRVVGNMISPNVSPDVQALMSRGVAPTPGQILGGGFARTEAKLTSVPVLGDMIKNAQGRALGQFNEAAYNEALAPIGQKFTGKVGQEGIEQVGKQIGNVYDNVLPQMQLKVDPQFQSDVMNLGQMAQSLPDTQQKQFMNILQNQIFGKLGPQGNMDGQTLKGVQSELARTAKGYLGDPSYDNRQLGAAVSSLRDAVDSNLTRVNPPDLSQQLANANSAWANYVRLRTAAASTGAMNNDGVFTAAQLQNAVRGADKSVGKGATATGNALMQDLSSAGQSVLGSKYPDSGTVGRGLLSLLAPGSVAAGLATAPGSTLATLGGIGLGSIPYTSLGQRGIASLLTARPQFAQPVAKAVGALSPVVIPGGLSALLSGSR